MKNSPFAFLTRGGAVLATVTALWAGLAAAPAAAQPSATITGPQQPVNEGTAAANTATFTVTLSQRPSSDVVLQVATMGQDNAAGRTATAGADFVAKTQQLTFNATSGLSQPFTVSTVPDNINEPTEYFDVQISQVSGQTVNTSSQNRARATIMDDDPAPALVVTGNSVTEGNSGTTNLRFVVTLTDPADLTTPRATSSDVTFNYTTVGVGNCVPNQDFLPRSGTATITAQTTSVNIDVPVIGDTQDEVDEMFYLDISNVSSNAAIGTDRGVGYIGDDDAPAIRVTEVANVQEGGRAAFQIQLVRPGTTTPTTSPQDITIRYRTVPGPNPNDARAGSDYVSLDENVTIPTGSTQATVFVDTLDDAVYEGGANATTPEEFLLQVYGVDTNGVTIDSGTGVGRIQDNESKPYLVLTDTAVPANDGIVTSVKEGNNGSTTQMVFSGTISTQTERPLFFSYRTEVTSGGNSATAGQDYTSKTGTIQITGTSTEFSFSVNILGDNVEESNETVQVRLYAPTGVDFTSTRQTELTTLGQIADDDGAQPLVNVTGPGSLIEGDSGTKIANFTISLSKAVAFPVRVTYSTQDVTTTANEDYITATDTVTFEPGNTEIPVQVVVNGDTVNEPDEAFRLAITGVVNAGLGAASAQVTITNDDVRPRISSIASISQPELTKVDDDDPAYTAFNFQVTIDRASSSAQTFPWDVVGDASSPARAVANDFGVRAGQVTFLPFQTTATITVDVTADALNEADENFLVRVFHPTNGRLQIQGTGTIRNDDVGGTVTLEPSFEGSDENSETANLNNPNRLRYRVTLEPEEEADGLPPAGQPVVINYTVNGSGDNPATPGAGRDIIPASGSVTIPVGQASTEIVLTIVDDTQVEGDEEITLSITPATAGWTVEDADRTAEGTIVDNDAAITKVEPLQGFANTDGTNSVDGNGTDVVITGSGFRFDDDDQVSEVRFGVQNPAKRDGVIADFTVNSATQVTAHLPYFDPQDPAVVANLSGFITVKTSANTAVSPKIFYSQPIITSVAPEEDVVPGTTEVTLRGRNFRDPLNPVETVEVDGVPVDGPNSGGSWRVVNAQTMVIVLPRSVDGTVVPAVRTVNGGDGPESTETITTASFTAGGVQFVNPSTLPVPENTYVNPVVTKDSPVLRTWFVQLNPATTGNDVDIMPRGNITVRVSIKDNVAQDRRVTAPQIATPSGRATFVSNSTIDFTFPANEFPTYKVMLVDSGDDNIAPVFPPNVFFGQRGTDATLTLTAEIIRSGDGELYPVNDTDTFDVNRYDLHGVSLDITTNLNTTEDPNSPQHEAQFVMGLQNLEALHPNGDENTEAIPEADVFIPLRTSDASEGLLSWYTRRRGSTEPFVGSGQSVPSETINVRYSRDPNSLDYYGHDHVIVVTGQDDDLPDRDVIYNVLIDGDQVLSADPEYQFTQPGGILLLSNTDNEQGGGGGAPGFTFETRTQNETQTPVITVDEFGGSDFFRVRLRREPTAKVVLRFRTSNPNEGLLVDPATNQLVEVYDIAFYPDSATIPADNKSSRWDVNQTVTVQGLAVGGDDPARQFSILTLTPDALNADRIYAQIDPVDVTVNNLDNSSFVIEPTTGVTISENNGTAEVGVRLSRQPTSNVTVNFTTSDNGEARLRNGTASVDNFAMLFTPQNYGTAQTLRIAGVDDTLRDGTQIVSITSTVASDDATFSGAAVAKPRITVRVTDDETGTGGGENPSDNNTSVFAPKNFYAFSLPYMTSAVPTATATAEQLFNLPMQGNYVIYRYDATRQNGKQLAPNEKVELSHEMFVQVRPTEQLRRGVGYIIQTFDKEVAIRNGRKVSTTAVTRFAVDLTRNTSFTGGAQYNGLNLIGFPFDVNQYVGVDFTACRFKLDPADKGDVSYQQAIGAGWISPELYRARPDGTVEKLPADQRVIKPFGAYYVQIYVNNLRFIMLNPRSQ